MSNPYEPLDTNSQNTHLANNLAGYPSPYPSGEAHFFDTNQIGVASLLNGNQEITIATSGLFDRNGLISPFSSGPQSRNYAITDFKSFNPYRHYVVGSNQKAGNDNAYKINTSELLTKSIYNFNIYSISFRTNSTTPLN